MTDQDLATRKQIGILLRAPLVGLLGLAWIVFIWWWVAAIGLAFWLAVLVLTPIAYPAVWVWEYARLAITNSDEPLLPDYWTDYPDLHIQMCKKTIMLGFPALGHLLHTGSWD